MQEFDLVIRGGTVVTAADTTRADIGILDGQIVAVALDLPGGSDEIDASGLLVMPGGIDSHVHLAQPSFGGPRMADDFETGTRSALAGGNTTVMPFALQPRGASLRESVLAYHKEAEGRALCDYSFHIILANASTSVLEQELPSLIAEGYTSLKIFMTYDDLVLNDREILDVLDSAGRHGALVMVHCEGYDAIRYMTERLELEGKTAPFYHAASRPQAVEREATHRAISHAELTGSRIMIVHVSGREAMEQIRWAQQRGLPILAETCTQYVSLTAEDLKGLNMDESGGKYVCSPPPRDRASWEAIWEGLRTGVFQTFSSDHCPFFYEGPMGKLNPKARTSFRWVPNGIPGVAVRMPILFSEGVRKGRISLNEFVALTSTNHARIYDLYPRKGSIAPGCDADLVLWDADRRVTISQNLMQHGSDYTPFEGMEVVGWPVTTLVRGRVAMHEGEILARPGDGDFIARPGRPRESTEEPVDAPTAEIAVPAS